MERIVIGGILIICCILSLIVTFYLGVSQSQKQNTKYDRSRKKTVIVLSMIYLISLIVGGLLLLPLL